METIVWNALEEFNKDFKTTVELIDWTILERPDLEDAVPFSIETPYWTTEWETNIMMVEYWKAEVKKWMDLLLSIWSICNEIESKVQDLLQITKDVYTIDANIINFLHKVWYDNLESRHKEFLDKLKEDNTARQKKMEEDIKNRVEESRNSWVSATAWEVPSL